MVQPELRPAARRALRRRTWGALGLLISGAALAVGTATILVLAVEKAGDEGRTISAPGAGLPVIAGGAMVFGGLEILVQNRALRRDGRRVELRPVFAIERRRRWGIGTSRWDHVERAWLVTSGPTSAADLAIPIEPALAARAVGGTAAIVRGRLQPGSRVALDFPDEVAFPVGRVAAVRPDLPERAAFELVEPMSSPSRWSVLWRLTLAGLLALLALGTLLDGIESDEGDACGRVPGALLDPKTDECLDEAQFVAVAVPVCSVASIYLVWRARQRRDRRQRQGGASVVARA